MAATMDGLPHCLICRVGEERKVEVVGQRRHRASSSSNIVRVIRLYPPTPGLPIDSLETFLILASEDAFLTVVVWM